ncbi:MULTISPECIES: LacI family DNA-binding transcriptional regulator [Streptomyces]|uniref:LacI family DNA-binding transcriptional regulator n=2 Tax=Streptomyces TaxID=1883 RepID=A0A5N5ZTA6_9ACTN|nr:MULTISPECIES: LacI family DNA-binding transcriptional regulator [Streptomyces]KAB8159475.1 LacI family DNA-binding transcriptional regulator [Streptomyces mimosae]KAB8172637.1 LacI family DNA-binding transcriptional regulator [Streptomyces sp. 3MP-14]RMI46210.1 LacI family transcriptional regulator [Streptomyces triticirhizae]
MAASIMDVARRAEVSTATVSRALRGLPNVSAATRERVLRAAEELSYSVSPHASSLASGRTGTVGVVVPFVNRWFYSQVLAGIDSVLRAHDLDLLLYNLGDERVHERFFTRMPLRRRVDALIVLNLPLSTAESEALASMEVPIAVLGTRVPGCWHVSIDNAEGASTAVRHLINLGHRRIGMITAAPGDPRGFTTPIVRQHAYRTVLAQAGIAYDPDLEVPGHLSIDEGASAMAQLLSLPEPPTAVFAESDQMAFGALRTLGRMGLTAPDDVSVIGFDDHETAELLDLTTIAQPVAHQGELLARQILDALSGGDEEPTRVVVPTRLVVRGTTGAAREHPPRYHSTPRPGPEPDQHSTTAR